MASLYHGGKYLGECDPSPTFDISKADIQLVHYRDAWIFQPLNKYECMAFPRDSDRVLPPITVRSAPMWAFFRRVRKELVIT